MKKKMVALLAGAMMMLATSAMATPINGSVNFFGVLSLVGGTSLPTATGIHFNNPALVADGGTGIYSGIPSYPSAGIFGSTAATFTDFSYNPTLTPVPVDPLWTVTYGSSTYAFDLTSISSITATSISGQGVLEATGYDDTVGFWQLTTQNGGGTLSFSASSAVPEPGTMMLVGLGMLGMAVYGKRRQNKEA